MGGDTVLIVELKALISPPFLGGFSGFVALPGSCPGSFHEETPAGCSFVAANLPETEAVRIPVVDPPDVRPCRAFRSMRRFLEAFFLHGSFVLLKLPLLVLMCPYRSVVPNEYHQNLYHKLSLRIKFW